jgi:hypothetical protein
MNALLVESAKMEAYSVFAEEAIASKALNYIFDIIEKFGDDLESITPADLVIRLNEHDAQGISSIVKVLDFLALHENAIFKRVYEYYDEDFGVLNTPKFELDYSDVVFGLRNGFLINPTTGDYIYNFKDNVGIRYVFVGH